jgi:hypothetical protein
MSQEALLARNGQLADSKRCRAVCRPGVRPEPYLALNAVNYKVVSIR